MRQITTRNEFIDYCLRRLGHPVITINVDSDQINDRIDDTLQYFNDYHFEGVERMYLKHQITQQDIDRRWIYCPESVIFVMTILPFDQSSSSVNMFDLRYQLRLHDLYDFTSVSYVSYEITMQHIQTLNILFSGYPQIRFNRHLNRLNLDIDWTRDVHAGDYIILECYRALRPDNITIPGKATISNSSNTVIGTSTVFSRDIVIGDEITFGSEIKRVVAIDSDVSLNVDSSFATNSSNVTMIKTGNSSVWNDRFLKRYATAMIKLQWGNNLSKYSGIQMPGGVTMDGVRIMNEAQAEIDKIEQEMQQYNVMPDDMLIG